MRLSAFYYVRISGEGDIESCPVIRRTLTGVAAPLSRDSNKGRYPETGTHYYKRRPPYSMNK